MNKLQCSGCNNYIDSRESHNGAPLYDGRVCWKCNYSVIERRLEDYKNAK